MADADLAAFVAALAAAQQRRDLGGLNVAAVAINQLAHVQPLRVLAGAPRSKATSPRTGCVTLMRHTRSIAGRPLTSYNPPSATRA
jgi:hypothetical protein